MLILSKHKDYYDTAIGYGGIDKSIVYDRKTTIVTEQPVKLSSWRQRVMIERRTIWDTLRRRQAHDKKEPWQYIPFIFGFCGKTYVGYYIAWLDRKCDITYQLITFDQDEVHRILVTEREKDKPERRRVDYKREWANTVSTLYDVYHKKADLSLFVKYRVPAYVIDFGTPLTSNEKYLDAEISHYQAESALILNPVLKDYELNTVFDAFTAHQEIEMFLGGVLGRPEKEVDEVPDKYRLAQHGFDKWSFRKEPNESAIYNKQKK